MATMKRSSAARKTAGVKVRITPKQRKARQLNIEVARQHRKKAGGTKKMIRKGVNAPKAPLTRTQRKKKGLPTNAKEMAKIKRKSVGGVHSDFKSAKIGAAHKRMISAHGLTKSELSGVKKAILSKSPKELRSLISKIKKQYSDSGKMSMSGAKGALIEREVWKFSRKRKR